MIGLGIILICGGLIYLKISDDKWFSVPEIFIGLVLIWAGIFLILIGGTAPR